MKRFLTILSVILVAAVAGMSWAGSSAGQDKKNLKDSTPEVRTEGSSVDQHIKNLKDPNPEVRAKAAYDLGCG